MSSKSKIILFYIIFGFLWIFFSDNILHSFVSDVEQLNTVQSYKGWLFILLTSLLLYFLISSFEKEKNLVEKDLKKSEEHYRSLLNQSPFAIEVYNKDGLQIYVNNAHEKLWGISSFVTLNKLNILTDKKFEKSGLLPFVKKAYNGEIVKIPTYKFNPAIMTSVTNDKGEEKLVTTDIYPIKDENNNVIDIVVTHIDMTLESKLKKFDNILSSIFQVIPDILFIMKKDGTIIDYRAETTDNLYLQPEFFVGKKMQEVLPLDLAELFEEKLKVTQKEKKLLIFDYELEIDGVRKNFESRMSKLPEDDYIIAIVRDITENVKSKEKLKFQSLLLEQSLAATDVVTEDGKFSYVNDSYVKMWGYKNSDEILGTSPISHCVDPEIPKRIIEKIEKDKEHIFQFKAKKKDGKTFDALMATKYFQFNGKKYYVGSTLDISEKLSLLKKYEVIFNNAREGVFLHELDGTIIDVNPYIAKLHNVSKEELIGKNIAMFFKEEDIGKAEVLINELMKNGEVNFEMELQKIDYSLFYASIKSQIIEFEGRKVIYGTLKDFTSSYEDMLLLERSKKVFENLQEGVMITDKNGYIKEVNKAFSKITEYSYFEAVGSNASILKSGKHNKIFYEKLWESLENKNKWSGKIVNKKKSGDTYISFLTISPIHDIDGKIQNYIGVFSDISDLLKYEKELREKDIILIQQSKMASMGEMIDNIAHQWRQPLNTISASVSGIKLQKELDILTDNTLINGINAITNSTQYLSETIDDFRNFFNSDKKKNKFLIESCINRLFILISSKIKNKQIEVIKNIENVEVLGVENDLVQVLINIVSNAIDALEERKEYEKRFIFINSYKEDNSLFILIKDNAGGIPEDIKNKIFESKFTTKKEGKGTGIGLYMSEKIIDTFNGDFYVENEEYLYELEKYKGATFTIRIPL